MVGFLNSGFFLSHLKLFFLLKIFAVWCFSTVMFFFSLMAAKLFCFVLIHFLLLLLIYVFSFITVKYFITV